MRSSGWSSRGRCSATRRASALAAAVALAAPAASPAATPNGGLDASFGGGDGVSIVGLPGFVSQRGSDVLRLSGGRIVVAGAARTGGEGTTRLLLVAFDSSGRLDPSFSGDGRVATHFSGSGGERASAVIAARDGKLVAVGQVDNDEDGGSAEQFAVVRYERDGKLDSSFASNGGIRIGFFAGRQAQATAVAEQPDGKLVVAGSTETATGTRFALVRLMPDGKTRDASFGTDGRVVTAVTPAADAERIDSLLVEPGGSIVAVGEAGGLIATARYRPDGTLDRGFDADGLRLDAVVLDGRPAIAQRAAGVVRDPNGRLVIAGDASFSSFERALVAIRLTPAGTPDGRFGRGTGTSIVDFRRLSPDRRAVASAEDLVRTGDGRYLIGGALDLDPDESALSNPSSRFALARLGPAGGLDREFGGDGMVLTNLSTADESIRGLAIQPDGGLVAAGLAGNLLADGVTADRIAIARYHGVRDTFAPRAAFALADGQTLADVARTGRLSLDLLAQEALTSTLTATVFGNATTGASARRLARLTATARATRPGTRRVSIRLGAVLAQLLARHVRARVTISAALRDSAGNRGMGRATIVLLGADPHASPP